MRIILASGSPRRRELMVLFTGLETVVHPARGEEKPHPELTPEELVRELSRAKAAEAAESFPDDIVLGADTVVVCAGEVLGKPKGENDAARMLHLLSGREHEVLTGVTLIARSSVRSVCEKTSVHFREMTDGEIAAYIATGEPMDKAGAYGIQGAAALFIERIEGDYYNVMGLPVCRVGGMLKELGVNLL